MWGVINKDIKVKIEVKIKNREEEKR